MSRKNKCFMWYLMPSLAGVLLFYVIPFGLVIYYALVNNPIQKEFVGLANLTAIVQNKAFLLALKNTLLFIGISVPSVLVISLGLAVLLEGKLPFGTMLRFAIFSPMLVPVVSVVLVWRVLFDFHGTLNHFFSYFGFTQMDWLKSNYALWMMIGLFLWKNAGYHMILFLAGLSAVPKEAAETAKLEGAGNIRIFFQIKLHYLSPTIFFVTLLSCISAFKIFREVYVLTGNYPYETLYLLQHFMNNVFRTLDYQKMCSAAIVISLIVMAIIAVLFALEYYFGKDMEG